MTIEKNKKFQLGDLVMLTTSWLVYYYRDEKARAIGIVLDYIESSTPYAADHYMVFIFDTNLKVAEYDLTPIHEAHQRMSL